MKLPNSNVWWAFKEARKLPCPDCEAEPGAPCEGKKGTLHTVHVARLEAYRAATPDYTARHSQETT